MRLHYFFLTWFTLTILFVPLLVEVCSAAFFPSNNITLEKDGMIWGYQEKITENESVLFRGYIDMQMGNSDHFVNAWEILKAEVAFRDKMKEAIESKPDVKLNGTAENVKARNVEFWVTKEALGKTEKNSSITNYAIVSYSFEKGLNPGTEIWFLGTPKSEISITLPVGFDAAKTEGLDNKSLRFEDNRTVLKGKFSSEKNITVWLSENESFKADLQNIKEKEKTNTENTSTNRQSKTITTEYKAEIRESLGFLKGILNSFT